MACARAHMVCSSCVLMWCARVVCSYGVLVWCARVVCSRSCFSLFLFLFPQRHTRYNVAVMDLDVFLANGTVDWPGLANSTAIAHSGTFDFYFGYTSASEPARQM